MSLAPWRIKPAPKIGEHSQEVYIHELGMSEAEYTALVQGGIT
jgi:crotonobetainyl-CoA:carnitine CoA-transferase CaiB-like acyl-CoA transferase